MTAYDLCWSAMGMLNYWVGDGKFLGASEAGQEGGAGHDPAGEEAARREGRQEAMQQGLLGVHGLEFDKKWIRLLRVIKTQVFDEICFRPCFALSPRCH